jgi:hypothetical protein
LSNRFVHSRRTADDVRGGDACWACGVGAAGGAPIALTATFFDTKPSPVLLEAGGDTRPAFQVRAASGAKFEGAGVSFWEARGEAKLRWKGADLTCRRR